MPPKDNPDKCDQKAQDYADAIPDETGEGEDYEPTYRDGSLKNECWNDGSYGSHDRYASSGRHGSYDTW